MEIAPVLVLGATGRIGTILRRCWGAAQMPCPVSWQARTGDPGAGLVVFDPLGDPGAMARAASGAGVLLCLAGVVPGRGDLGHNAALAEAAVRAGAAGGARVLLASSAAVYGDRSGLLEEGAPLAPVSAYGRAKAEMEARALALGSRLGVSVCALRIGNIAGIDAVLGGWRPGFALDRFADGRTPRRSYIGVQTLARVLGALVRAGDLPPVLNVAQPGVVEMGALLDAAGLGWRARPAPDSAIAEVALSTAALARFAAPVQTASAEALAEEWRALKELAP